MTQTEINVLRAKADTAMYNYFLSMEKGLIHRPARYSTQICQKLTPFLLRLFDKGHLSIVELNIWALRLYYAPKTEK